MNPKFDYAFKYLLGDEGIKFTNDPDDSGGATKFGITQKSLAAYEGRPVSIQDVQSLTSTQAQIFYWEEYWRKLCCNRMTNVGTAIAIFDTGVLYGQVTAAQMAQRAVVLLTGATLKFDGIIGDKSIGLLNLANETQFLEFFRNQILLRIAKVIAENPKNEKFRNGWTNRANRLLTLSNAKNEIETETKLEGKT